MWILIASKIFQIPNCYLLDRVLLCGLRQVLFCISGCPLSHCKAVQILLKTYHPPALTLEMLLKSMCTIRCGFFSSFINTLLLGLFFLIFWNWSANIKILARKKNIVKRDRREERMRRYALNFMYFQIMGKQSQFSENVWLKG